MPLRSMRLRNLDDRGPAARARPTSAALMLAIVGACASAEDDPIALPTTSQGSFASTTGDSPPSSTSGITSSPVSAGTDSAADWGTVSAGATSGGCPVGTAGCPCNVDWCEPGLECVDGTCQQTAGCNDDPHEPNDDEGSAIDLGIVEDSANASVAAVLASSDDVDWFVYEGDDDIFASVDPSREVAATKGLRFCKFAECLGGLETTELGCPRGTNEATSPSGRPGCCSSTGFTFADFNCSGTTEDNAKIYFRVDQAAGSCVDYTINYSY